MFRFGRVDAVRLAHRAVRARNVGFYIDEYFENGEGAFVAIDTAAVRTAIKSAPKGRTKDVEGVRFEHLQGIVLFQIAYTTSVVVCMVGIDGFC